MSVPEGFMVPFVMCWTHFKSNKHRYSQRMPKEGGHRARPSRGAGGRSPMKRLLCLIPCVHRYAREAKEHRLEASVPSDEPSEQVS